MRKFGGLMLLAVLVVPAGVSLAQPCAALAHLGPGLAGRRLSFAARLGVDVRRNGNYIRACGAPVPHRIAPGSQADRAWRRIQAGMVDTPANMDHEVYIDVHGIRARVSGTVVCGRLGRCVLRVDQIRNVVMPKL